MKPPPLFRRCFRLALGFLSLMSALVAQDAKPQAGEDDLPQPDHPPKVIKREPPVYPGRLGMAGLVGRVEVAFIVDETGAVVSAHAMSSNNPWFERPAIDAVKRWRFEPATKEGKPVKTRVIQQIRFEFGGEQTVGLGLDLTNRTPVKPQNYWQVPPLREPEKLPPALRWKTAPEPISTAFPLYPYEALRAKQKGHTKIRFLVGADGRVAGAKVLEASAPEFGQAVLATLDRWRFNPAKFADGSPAQALLAIDHDFLPNGNGDAPVTDEAKHVLRLLEKTPEKIVAWTDLDRAPRPVWQHAVVYPTALRDKGETGSAQIEFYVDENGDAQLPRVVEASAPEFGFAAAQAVATWRFEAPRKAGKPVVTRVRVPLKFTLKDPPAPAAK